LSVKCPELTIRKKHLQLELADPVKSPEIGIQYSYYFRISDDSDDSLSLSVRPLYIDPYLCHSPDFHEIRPP